MNTTPRMSLRSSRILQSAVVLSLLIAGVIAIRVRSGAYRVQAVRPDNAVGDEACLSCHPQQAAFELTAHRLTSRPTSRENILGNFSDGENILRTANTNLYFRMDSTADGYYETAVIGHPPDTSVRSERIAYVTGSRKGQSYLYWSDDRLYQLPVSYWAELGWANSPAYPDGRPNFDRPIPPRCLECHTTWFESVPEERVANRYRRGDAMLGIQCETCHGAGQEHAKRERSPLNAVLTPAIVNPARLPRERQLDGCALCHSGTAPLRTAAFSYVPGEPLEKRLDLWASPDTAYVDVHGNQLALLERSRCFTQSQMTCATCHDVHREERDVADLSDRCLTCHTAQSGGAFPHEGEALTGQCVDCHMPALLSKTVVANHLGEQQYVRVRTHWIKVYPELP